MSSDSSDDEEEAKRIGEAVVPDDFLASLMPCLPQTESEKSTSQAQKTENKYVPCSLKSKRYHNDHIEDHGPPGYFVKTTPEFRAHVAKQLTKLLDREVETIVEDSVWNCSAASKKKKQRGIRLFSNAKSLCLGESQPPSESSTVRPNPTKIQQRKHKLSSSDSSDEEDKILSCVFTVDDIRQENHLLESFTPTQTVPGAKSLPTEGQQESEQKADTNAIIRLLSENGEEQGAGHNNGNSSNRDSGSLLSPPSKKMKKKKKKKKNNFSESAEFTKEGVCVIVRSKNKICDQSIVNCETEKKKSKKKKKKKMSDVSL